jgi:chemotaxis protein methyltransferase CheR
MTLDNILAFFAKYIEKELGIIYAEHNYFQLENRLEDIAKHLGVQTLEALYELNKTGIKAEFKQLLLDTATNNETSFFRDPKIFRAIEKVLLATSDESKFKKNKLRIWSAASSTGQEAISISIMINEFKKKTNSSLEYSIIGTDISERVLERAKSASYTALEVQRGLPANCLANYFLKNDQEIWTATNEVTRNIGFQKLNLIEPFPFHDHFHLILCRNVLIYQNIESKKEIIKRMTQLLHPGGLLILGCGESLLGISTDYEQQNIDGAIVYIRK